MGKLEDLRLLQDGVEVHRGFLNRSATDELGMEIDAVFERPILNIRRASSIWLQNGTKTAATPTAFRAVNLLEVCVDIMNLIPPEMGRDLIVTNLEVLVDGYEKSQFWHTDRRKGMVRAILYLRGGGASSGGLRYIRGTHDLDHLVDHRLEDDELHLLSDRIVHCISEPGDLVLFDSFGFHAKGPCMEDRSIAMFEFQPRNSNFSKASVDLNSRSLTPRVLERIDLFTPGDREETYGESGIEVYRNNAWFSDHGAWCWPLLRAVSSELLFLLRTMAAARARALVGPLMRRIRRSRDC